MTAPATTIWFGIAGDAIRSHNRPHTIGVMQRGEHECVGFITVGESRTASGADEALQLATYALPTWLC